MIRFFLVLITTLVTSFFLFPFDLPVGIAVNTKMVLALLGACAFGLDKSLRRDPYLTKDLIVIFMLTATVSVWGFLVTSVNNTSDYSYARYIISVAVWFFAAYFVVWLIRQIHGTVDVKLLGCYLIGVCVFQCVLAYSMTLSPALKRFVDSLMAGSIGTIGRFAGRLYGLGAALDPAGLRFSAILVLDAFIISRTDFGKKPFQGALLIVAFLIISVIGNIMARTTTVGMIVGLVCIIVSLSIEKDTAKKSSLLSVSLPVMLILLILSVWLYNVFPDFRSNVRFGFEGFFSLVETGRWEVHSNDVLRGMIVWPESLKTWLIGDGYFNSPLDNPDRFGQVYEGFYMQTDIGYLRFIFYFGVIGLLGMISIFVKSTLVCVQAFRDAGWMFVILLLINLIGWMKVSSDIIMVFAPFVILAFQKDALKTNY